MNDANLELLAELRVDVESDEGRVGEPRPGELDEQFGQRGGEQQCLAAVGQAMQDLAQLLRETHLKQPGQTENSVSWWSGK